MSQEKVDRYKEEKKNREKNMKKAKMRKPLRQEPMRYSLSTRARPGSAGSPGTTEDTLANPDHVQLISP